MPDYMILQELKKLKVRNPDGGWEALGAVGSAQLSLTEPIILSLCWSGKDCFLNLRKSWM